MKIIYFYIILAIFVFILGLGYGFYQYKKVEEEDDKVTEKATSSKNSISGNEIMRKVENEEPTSISENFEKDVKDTKKVIELANVNEAHKENNFEPRELLEIECSPCLEIDALQQICDKLREKNSRFKVMLEFLVNLVNCLKRELEELIKDNSLLMSDIIVLEKEKNKLCLKVDKLNKIVNDPSLYKENKMQQVTEE